MKIVIVEDHQIVSQGIASSLREQGHVIVDEIYELPNVLSTLSRHNDVDILLSDYKMRDGNTFDVLQEIKESRPRLKIIVLTGIQSSIELRRLANSNIDGLILKEGASLELAQAISKVCSGHRYISPLVEPHLTQIEAELTGREMQVLNMIVMGLARKDIAEQMGIGVESVKTYRKNLLTKLRVNNTVELILKAQQMKLLDLY